MSLMKRAVSTARALGIDTTGLYQNLSTMSIQCALKEQGYMPVYEKIREIVPDLTDQYTANFDQEAFATYWEIKMRGLHAFQTQCALDAIAHLDDNGLTIVDLGDSSGNHSAYIRALAPKRAIKRVVSVNLDEKAVKKINRKGGEAVLARVEDFTFDGVEPDLLVSFETLEHILDPVGFLHSIALKGTAEHIVLSVPYRRHSRFGGALIRQSVAQLPKRITPEETHIFELCPSDWELLARFAGFKTVFNRLYYQYPKKSLLRATAGLWRRLDFEGFLVLFLKRDTELAERYTGWP